MKKQWWLLAVLALMGGVLVQMSWLQTKPIQFEHGVWFEPHRGQPEVTLQTSLGDERAWPIFQSPHLVFFGFTYCPDICPTTLYELKAVQQEIPDLKIVFVSLDPERDTPERLGQYLSRLGPNYIGVTNHQAVLDKITQFFTVPYQKVVQGDSYTIDHSGTIFFVDAKGNWRGLFSHGTAPMDLVADLKKVMH